MRSRFAYFAFALVMAAAACAQQTEVVEDDDGAEPQETAGVSLRIAPLSGPVKGNVVSLTMESSGITIKGPDGDTSGTTGHYHVFIDKDPVAAGEVVPREAGIVHSADNPVKLYGMSPGEHKLTVVLGDGTHRRIGDTQAETTVTVEGPSIDATAPATSPAGQPVSVDVKVEGVELAGAAADTSNKSGTHGHLHVFVDREPTPAGQPIPPASEGVIHSAEKTIKLENLAPGEHVVWVVLGYADHTPFDPPVVDRLTVTVQ